MVKIQLENFLCHQDSVFELGENGLSLISGRSGKGKTSILKGIFFALFGSGSKLQTYGKKSAKVTLQFEDMKIVRTKCPNRLILNDKYEDKAAQEIINKKFGKAFETSGYARQNNLSSFILMSPTDKLLFLEKFAFENIDLREIKAKCKANITSTNKALISATSQLEMAVQILKETEKPKVVKCPLKCKPKNRDKVIKNENIRLKNSIILIKKNNKLKSKLEKQLTEAKVLEAVLDTNKMGLEKVEDKIKIVREEIDSIDYIGDEKLLEYKNQIRQLSTYKKLLELKSTYKDYSKKLKDMKEKEEKSHKTKIQQLSEKLWDQYTEIETKETIQDLEQCIKEIEKLNSIEKAIENIEITESSLLIKSDIESLEKKLKNNREIYSKLKLEKNTYVCPCCKANLSVKEDKLVEIDCENLGKSLDIDEITKLIKEISTALKDKNSKLSKILVLEQKLEDYKKDKMNIVKNYETIPILSEIAEDLEYMKNYKLENKTRDKKYKELVASEPYSDTCLEFEYETDALKEKIDELSAKYSQFNTDIDEEDLRQIIMKEQNNKILLNNLTTNLEVLLEEKEELDSVIDKAKKKYSKKYNSDTNIEEIEVKISEATSKITENELKREKQLTVLEKIEIWKNYEKELLKYNSWLDKISELKKAEELSAKRHASFLQLKEKILQAESISLQNIIDSINSHARLYLDDFFPEDPISVELHAFKENKKKASKPSINVRIEYKSMECSLNMLSGGELARVVLAYTLALAEMFSTPLLLLDECTASLDQEMSGIVFESIKDHFNGKVALIIAHQVVSGVFDKVIIL